MHTELNKKYKPFEVKLKFSFKFFLSYKEKKTNLDSFYANRKTRIFHLAA